MLKYDKATERTPVPFSATVGRDYAELYVTDGAFNVVAKGVGNIEANLQPGIYQLVQRVGRESSEQVFEIPIDGGPVHLSLDPLSFSSPIPTVGNSDLEAKADTDTYTRDFGWPSLVAGHTSVSLNFGVPREILASTDDKDWPFLESELKRLTFQSFDGKNSQPLSSIIEPGMHGCVNVRAHFSAPPGPYVLMQSLDFPRQRCIALWVAQDKLLQVFVRLAQAPDEKGEWQPAPLDLDHAAIVYTPSGTLVAPEQDDELRLLELSRKALSSGRTVIADDLTNKLLEMKFQHPMLGIMGAHLLLMAKEPDERRVQNIIDRSFDLLGRDFPDAIALRVQLANRFDRSPTRDDLAALSGPPMLRAGWDALKVARTRDDFVKTMTPTLDRLMRFEHKESATSTWHCWTEFIGARSNAKRREYDRKYRSEDSFSPNLSPGYYVDSLSAIVELLHDQRILELVNAMRTLRENEERRDNSFSASARTLLNSIASAQNLLVDTSGTDRVAQSILARANLSNEVTKRAIKEIRSRLRRVHLEPREHVPAARASSS